MVVVVARHMTSAKNDRVVRTGIVRLLEVFALDDELGSEPDAEILAPLEGEPVLVAFALEQ
ncbi:MAG: hypothetical protein M3133_04540 [Actinomycetota bacterium]|nr:hypothetical protein [Actinomycetota bacterium]